MPELDLEMVTFFLEEVEELLTKWEEICLNLEKSITVEELNALFRIAHNIKGSSASVGLMKLSKFIHIIEDVIVEIINSKRNLDHDVLRMFFEAQSEMQNWVDELKTDPNCDFYPQSFLDKHFSETSEKSEIRPETKLVVETEKKITPDGDPKKNKDEVLRINTKKIDTLLNLIGELSIQQSILQNAIENCGVEIPGTQISGSLNLSTKITKEIYDTAFGFRMTPVGGIFQRLERAIKDLSRDLGKEIDLEFSGHDIEIEKTILDKMLDPLTHIVRNSVDHGIEPKITRIELNKKEKGLIKILVSKTEDGIDITVADDGKGLSEKRIFEKAVEKNLVNPNTVLPREEVLAMIFLPGFSTAEKVTNVSGRGVGMDVVMKTIEEINGKISIGSEEGQGTKFRITIPTSLSIVDSLVVSVKDTQYVLPLNFLEEVIGLKGDCSPVDNKILLNKKIVPYIHLADVFGLECSSYTNDYPVLVTRLNGRKLAIGVDAIIGRHQSVVRSLNSCFEQSFAVSGGTILPSGEPGLILDVSSIINKFFSYLKSNTEVA